MQTINVLRPFVFSRMIGESKRAQEIKFTPGLHEVDDDVAAHPYISKLFADGRIESPAETKERLEKAAAIKSESDAKAAVQADRAAKAYARIVAVASDGKESAQEVERALNTPVGQLKRDAGQRDAEAINTPTLKLKAGQMSGKHNAEVSMPVSAVR